MIFSICLLLLLIIGLGTCFYFLHLRVENLGLRLNSLSKNIDALYANQKVFDTDLKKIFNEFQNVKKEINRNSPE